jgi:hypothetical protein
VAMLGYEARVKRGTGEPYRALCGSLYLRREGVWKIASHQHTLLEPEQAT